MAKSKMKITKNGVTFEDNTEQVIKTMRQITIDYLYDVSRVVKYKFSKEARSSLKGLKKTKRIRKTCQSWIRGKELDLQIGYGKNLGKGAPLSGEAWYAIAQELGTKTNWGTKQKEKGRTNKSHEKKGLLREAVFDSINDIKKISEHHFGKLSDDNPRTEGKKGGEVEED